MVERATAVVRKYGRKYQGSTFAVTQAPGSPVAYAASDRGRTENGQALARHLRHGRAPLHVAISNCIEVGDSVWDLPAAVRQSALGVGLLSGGYGQEELENAGAFRLYSDATDMLMHIEQLGLPGK